MPASIVQSTLCTNNSALIGTGGGSVSTSGTYLGGTTSGNLLLAFAYSKLSLVTGISLSASSSFTFTDNLSSAWTFLLGTGYVTSSAVTNGRLYALGNCGAINPTMTWQVTYGSSSATFNSTVEFCVFEVAGCPATTNYTTHGPLVDNTRSATGTSSTPTVSGFTTTQTDLIFGWLGGNSANQTATGGWSLGPLMSAATTGNIEYNTSVAPGTLTIPFGGGTQSNWGMATIAFKIASNQFSGTSVNYGYLFG